MRSWDSRLLWPVAWILALVTLGSGYLHLSARLDELERDLARLERPPPTSGTAEPDTVEPAPAPPSTEVGVPNGDEVSSYFPACSAVLATQVVHGVVARHGQDVFRCVREREGEGVDITGTLGIALQVQGDGSIHAVQLFGTVRDPSVTRCVAESGLGWRFPPLGEVGCAEVHVPFAFAPGTID